MLSRAGRWRGVDGDTLGAVGVTGRALTIVRATMPLRVTALHHVALPVSDLERSSGQLRSTFAEHGSRSAMGSFT